MFRRLAFASISCVFVMAACSDDDDTYDGLPTAGMGGRAGAGGQGGTAGRGGSPQAGRAGSPQGGDDGAGGVPPGDAGAGGGTVEPPPGGMPGEVGGSGGSSGAPDQGGSGGDPIVEPPGGAGGMPDPGVGGEGGNDGGLAGAGGEGGGAVEPVGLVVHYSFDENTGTTAEDEAGRFPAATLEKATWVPGRGTGSAVELSAEQAHVALPPGLFQNVRQATIATWVNVAAYNNWSRIFDMNAGNTKFVYLASRRDVPGMQFAIHTGVPAQDGFITTNADLPVNVWKHVAVTVDGQTYTLYIDGFPTARRTDANPRYPAEIEPSVAGWLGRSTFAVDAYFKGRLDEFRIYDEALTPAQVADLAWPDTDYTHLRFDETTGTTAVDSSDRDFDGTIVNNATFTPGRVGNGLLLTAANSQYVSLPPSVIATCNDLTVALWARMTSQPFNTRFLDIDGGVNGFMFFTPTGWNEGVRELRFNIYRSTQPEGQRDQLVSAPYPAETNLVGEWHHYAVTLSGDVATLYFDGAPIGTNTAFTFNPSDVTIRAEGGAPHAWIGRSLFWNAATNPDPHLDAAIDDVRISCRAFTASEIRLLSTP